MRLCECAWGKTTKTGIYLRCLSFRCSVRFYCVANKHWNSDSYISELNCCEFYKICICRDSDTDIRIAATFIHMLYNIYLVFCFCFFNSLYVLASLCMCKKSMHLLNVKGCSKKFFFLCPIQKMISDYRYESQFYSLRWSNACFCRWKKAKYPVKVSNYNS